MKNNVPEDTNENENWLIDTSDMRSAVPVPTPTPWMRLVDAFRHFRFVEALRSRPVPAASRLKHPETRRLAGVYTNADGTPFFVRGD